MSRSESITTLRRVELLKMALFGPLGISAPVYVSTALTDDVHKENRRLHVKSPVPPWYACKQRRGQVYPSVFGPTAGQVFRKTI